MSYNPSLRHSQEKFSGAVLSMISSTEPIQYKVASSYVHYISVLRENEIPEDLRPAFLALKSEITDQRPLPVEGHNYTKEEAEKIASAIFSLACKLEAK